MDTASYFENGMHYIIYAELQNNLNAKKIQIIDKTSLQILQTTCIRSKYVEIDIRAHIGAQTNNTNKSISCLKRSFDNQSTLE